MESVGNAEIRSIADGVNYTQVNDRAFMYADNVGTIEIGADEVGAVYETGGNPLINSQSGSATVDKLILHASAIKSDALTGTVLDIGAASTGERLQLSFTQNDVEIVGKLNFASDVELVTENNWTFDSVKSAGQHSAVGRTSDVAVNGVLGGTEKSVWNFLKAKSHAAFAFEAADESVVNEFTLVGKYDDVSQSGSFNHTYRDSAGGAYSRATGDNVSAKAESTNLIINFYGDYQITDGLDAYIGLTYSYGDNKSEREAAAGKAKVDYESDTFGAFGGLRYTIKPCGLPFSITPLLGVNYSAVLTKSATEKEYTGSDAMSYAGGDYHSIRSLAGFEAAYHCEDILRIAVSAMYAHEFLDNRYNVGYSLDPSMFVVSSGILRGSVIERDYAILGLGINGNVTDSVSVGANYNAEVSLSELNHHIGGYIRFEF